MLFRVLRILIMGRTLLIANEREDGRNLYAELPLSEQTWSMSNLTNRVMGIMEAVWNW